jgi:1-acyl-sn-glycerol-3-phosphate acyltransferase
VSVFYWVAKAILAPFLALFRPWAEGTENVPREGPAILASNHLSFADHFFGPLPLPRKVTFLAKAEYFTGRGLKGLVSKAFFRGVGQIPVDRAGGKASDRALATGLRVLAEGRLLGIYPEGTRTPDGRLYRGKTGVARLALESGAPVIPMAMVGTFELMPPGRLWPRLRIRPGVRFGKPLDFSRYAGLESDHLVLRAITDEIMYALMELSGQEYVDEYAQQASTRSRPRTGCGPAGGSRRPPGGEGRHRRPSGRNRHRRRRRSRRTGAPPRPSDRWPPARARTAPSRRHAARARPPTGAPPPGGRGQASWPMLPYTS